jgi:hypothetical protein
MVAAALAAVSAIAEAPPQPAVGWVMLGVNVRAMVNPNGSRVGELERFTSYSIRNLTLKKTFRADDIRDTFHLFEVPPGEYCVQEVRTYTNQDLPLCKDKSSPHFEVRAGEVLNLGYWVIGVFYDAANDRITYQRVDSFREQRRLGVLVAERADPEVVARARAASPPVVGMDLEGSVWYASDPDGDLVLFSFRSGGELDYETVTANGTSGRGDWRIDGDHVVIGINEYATYRARVLGDRLVGEYTNANGMWTKWIALCDPFTPVEYGDGHTPEVVWRRANASKRAQALPGDAPTGSVTVRFVVGLPFEGRQGPKLAVVPSDLNVIRSEPPGQYDELAKALVGDRRYAPFRGPEGFVARTIEETFVFPLPND